MSRVGKILFGVSGFSILVIMLVRTVLGGWLDWLYVPLVLFLVCGVGAFVVDIHFYKELLTMRTTKHGMNMLTLIGLILVLLVAVNFLSIRNNIKWDWTSEGLNSISDQTIKVLQTIDDKATVRFFFREGTPGVDQLRATFKETIQLYRDENSQVSIEFVNTIKRPGLAKEYGVDRAAAMVFIDYKDKRNQVDPLTEEGLTTAFLKVTRTKDKKVYSLIGHGELNFDGTGPEGGTELKKLLQDSGYQVETLSLVDQGSVPEDADALMILGPKTSLLEPELQAVRGFVKRGGHLFVAADPGERHNMALLTKPFGIQFNNDYVLDQFGQLLGASAAMALGRSYGSTEITKDFDSSMMTLFHLATSLTKDDGVASGITVSNLVQTGDTSFTTDQVSQGQVEVKTDRRGPHTLAMLSTGKHSDAGENGKDFSLVVVGDSDFLSNQLLFQHLNRDLAVNSMAYLLKESNLISIRPRQPAGTTLTLSRTSFMIFLFSVILPLPILLFGAGGFTWYRRRNA